MESLWLALYWGSPIGLGIFLLCLGGMICDVTQHGFLLRLNPLSLRGSGGEFSSLRLSLPQIFSGVYNNPCKSKAMTIKHT